MATIPWTTATGTRHQTTIMSCMARPFRTRQTLWTRSQANTACGSMRAGPLRMRRRYTLCWVRSHFCPMNMKIAPGISMMTELSNWTLSNTMAMSVEVTVFSSASRAPSPTSPQASTSPQTMRNGVIRLPRDQWWTWY